MPDTLRDNLVRKVIAAATLTAVDLRRQLVDRTPRSDVARPHTADAWNVTQPVFTGDAVEFRIRNPRSAADPPAIEWLEEGTRGGQIIMPKTAKVLAWTGPSGPVFARRVVRGATPAFHFLFGPTGVLTQPNVADVARSAFLRTR